MKLKILITSILMTFGAIGFTNAQTDSTTIKTKSAETDNYVPATTFRPFRLGIYGSIGSSWMKPKTTGYESQGARFAYAYGLLVDINFTENYTFSTGVSFNSLGSELLYPDSANSNETFGTIGIRDRAYRINYIEIPTLLKLKTNQMGYFTYFAQLGLRHNFRVSSFGNDRFEYDNPVKTLTTEDQDMHDYTSFYRLSFSFSAGAEYAISKSFSVFASIGYDNGLTNSLNNSNGKKNKNINKITGQKGTAFIKKFALTAGFLF